jgi:hypothetical protein
MEEEGDWTRISTVGRLTRRKDRKNEQTETK